MNVQIHAVHFDADDKLIDHVNGKLKKLKTYFDHIIGVEVFMKLDNIAHHIKDKKAEIKVHIPKQTLFVEHESKNFEESFDHAFDSLVTLLKRKKEKMAA